MKISEIIWLEEIVEKIQRKHSVTTEEVCQVFGNAPRYRFVEKGHRKDENVYVALGPTDGGRFLACFFVYKKNGRALLISARALTERERKLYGKK